MRHTHLNKQEPVALTVQADDRLPTKGTYPMAIVRMPHLTWRQRLAVGAGCLVFAAVGGMELPTAGATNIDVSVSSACVGTSWQVTLNAHNTHDAPLRIVNDNSVENWTATLAPGEAQSARVNPPDATFHYVWSSPDGHLVGTTTDTLTRPAGCAVATSTTVVPTTVAPTSTVPAPTTTVAMVESSVVQNPAPTTPPSAPGTTAPRTSAPPAGPSTTARLNLPATGSSPWTLGIGALLLLIVGGSIVGIVRFLRDPEVV